MQSASCLTSHGSAHACLELLVCFRMAYGLIATPSETFSLTAAIGGH